MEHIIIKELGEDQLYLLPEDGYILLDTRRDVKQDLRYYTAILLDDNVII